MKTVSILLLLFLMSCSTQSDYQQMKERELAKNIRVDSLFEGLHLGMTNKAYFDHCHKKNLETVFLHGSNNTMVDLPLETELSYPAKMSFFPEFKDDQLLALHVEIAYQTWSPWMKDRFSDHLLEEVLFLFENWYWRWFFKSKASSAWTRICKNRWKPPNCLRKKR